MIETKREAYIRRIENALKADDTEITHEIVFTEEAAREILELLEEKPERKRGHYIKGENGEWYCSECKRIDDKYSVANFCWYCGADMRGDQDE